MISSEIGSEFTNVERKAKRQRTSPTQIWISNNTTTPVVVESRMNTIGFSKLLRENLGESLSEIRPLRAGTGNLVFAKTNHVKKSELLKGLPGVKVREPKTTYNEHHFVILGMNRAIEARAIEDELQKKNVPFSKAIRITSRTTNAPFLWWEPSPKTSRPAKEPWVMASLLDSRKSNVKNLGKSQLK